MGYRSTMILGIAPKYKKEFEKILKEHELDKEFELAKGHRQKDAREVEMFIYEAEYLKWYDDFGDVTDIEELIHKALTKN
mgnify:FL=1